MNLNQHYGKKTCQFIKLVNVQRLFIFITFMNFKIIDRKHIDIMSRFRIPKALLKYQPDEKISMERSTKKLMENFCRLQRFLELAGYVYYIYILHNM